MLQKSSKAPHACRVSSAEFAGARASIQNPVALRPKSIHQLTDNVAESHKQGTTTLLCSGWLDPFPSDFGLISLV